MVRVLFAKKGVKRLINLLREIFKPTSQKSEANQHSKKFLCCDKSWFEKNNAEVALDTPCQKMDGKILKKELIVSVLFEGLNFTVRKSIGCDEIKVAMSVPPKKVYQDALINSFKKSKIYKQCLEVLNQN